MIRSLWAPILLLTLSGFLHAEEEFPYRYRGIVGRFALLEDPRTGKQILARPGLTIEGWNVVALDRNHIRLTRDGRQLDLPFQKPAPEKSGYTPPPYPYVIPSWKLEIQRKLREVLVNLDYTGVPLEKVLQDLAEQAQIRILPSSRIEGEIPAEKRIISLQSPPVPLAEALRLVLALPDLHAYPEEEGLRITLRSQSPPIDRSEEILQNIEWARPRAYKNWSNPLPREQRKTQTQRSRETLTSRLVTLHIQDSDLAKVLDRLLQDSSLFLVLDAAVGPKIKSNPNPIYQIQADNTPLSEVLDELLAPLGMDYIVQGSVIFIGLREKVHNMKIEGTRRQKESESPSIEYEQLRKVQIELPPQPLSMMEFLQTLEKRSGLPVRPGRDVWRMNLLIEIPVTKTSLFEILEHLANEYRIYGSFHNDTLYLVR